MGLPALCFKLMSYLWLPVYVGSLQHICFVLMFTNPTSFPQSYPILGDNICIRGPCVKSRTPTRLVTRRLTGNIVYRLLEVVQFFCSFL